MSAHRILESIEKSQRRQANLPEFRPGDSIKVWAKIREGEKTRLWIPEKLAYEGKKAPYGMLVFDIELVKIGQ